MTEAPAQPRPLWLLIEEKIAGLSSSDVEGASLEKTVKRVAGELDGTGHNVSRAGGNLLQLRWALAARQKVGKPMLQDIKQAIEALTLEDVADPYAATMKLIGSVGQVWPALKDADRRKDVLCMVEAAKLDLLVKKAKSLEGDQGIRLLIEQEVASDTIVKSLGITDEKLAEVNAAVEAERAERERVKGLLKEVDGKPDAERIKHLLTSNVKEALVLELAGVDQRVVSDVKASLQEELEAQRKKEEEEAARKKAEAEGPSLDSISNDDMLEHIEAIREIMGFSDKEAEIRQMCEQSQLPKCLVDIAVSDPDKLDELEKKAGG